MKIWLRLNIRYGNFKPLINNISRVPQALQILNQLCFTFKTQSLILKNHPLNNIAVASAFY